MTRDEIIAAAQQRVTDAAAAIARANAALSDAKDVLAKAEATRAAAGDELTAADAELAAALGLPPDPPTESAQGTFIKGPDGGTIINAKGEAWTLAGGVVKRGGVNAGFSSSVAELLYFDHLVHQLTYLGCWRWNGRTWVSAFDPRVPVWVKGARYAAGDIVRYAPNGKQYKAKFQNPGYNPSTSPYYWEVHTPYPVPAPPPPPPPGPDGLPAKIIAGYFPTWANKSLADIPAVHTLEFLFSMTPVVGGDGKFQFDFSGAIKKPDCVALAARGVVLILTIGGSKGRFHFANKAQADRLVASFIATADALGGKGVIRGIDFNNFEKNTGSDPAVLIYIVQQLRVRYGPDFIATAPPAPGDPEDLDMLVTMHKAGALTALTGQYYDWDGYRVSGKVKNLYDAQVAKGFPPEILLVGLASNWYWLGNVNNSLSIADCTREIKALKAAYGDRFRGVVGWSTDLDMADGNRWCDAMKALLL